MSCLLQSHRWHGGLVNPFPCMFPVSVGSLRLRLVAVAVRRFHAGLVRCHTVKSQRAVKHVTLSRPEASVLDLLCSPEVGLSRARAKELLHFGAVYRAPNGSGTRCIKVGSKEGEKAPAALAAGEYLRVHTSPKRFRACARVDWAGTVVADTEHFVVINKPMGVPSVPTGDNALENVPRLLLDRAGMGRLGSANAAAPVILAQQKGDAAAAATGEKGAEELEELLVTTRLDVPCQGLLVLAKTAEFLRYFTMAAARGDGSVRKEYVCLVRAGRAGAPPLSVGPLVHFMRPSKFAPKRLSDSPRMTEDGKKPWKRCELQVNAVRRCQQWKHYSGSDAAAVAGADRTVAPFVGASLPPLLEAGQEEGEGELLEVDLTLLTGRTHQIRAQLAHVGYPLAGDIMYYLGPRLERKANLISDLLDAGIDPFNPTLMLRCRELEFPAFVEDGFVAKERGPPSLFAVNPLQK